MIDKLLLNLRARDEVSADEERVLREAMVETRDHPADQVIIREGKPLDASTLLLDGFMCRYKDLASGGRQISALHIPGDFVDLHSFPLHCLDHSILTMTRCRVVSLPHARIREISEKMPHLARLLWLLTVLDAAMHREWELSLGRRSALSRTAHLFCELLARMEVVGLTDSPAFDLPLTQVEVAECVGLTAVHVNRVLRELREAGLMEFRHRRVAILDRARLEQVAEFRPNYLYLEQRPR